MAAPISNTFNLGSTSGNTQTTTPATNSGGGFLAGLGIGGNNAFGGKALLPTPAAAPATQTPAAPIAPLVSTQTSAAAPAAPSSVNLSGVPASAVAALSSSGLTGSELVAAQTALANHYSSIGQTATPSVTSQQQTPTTPTPQTTPNTGTSNAPAGTPGVFSSVLGSLSNPQTNPIASQAATDYTTQNQALENYEANAGQTLQGIYEPTVTTSGAVMQGRANAAQQAINETIGNLQNAVIKQQGLITIGQNQQQLNQGAQESALGSLATGQPQFVYNPQTGQYNMNVGGSGVQSPQQVAQQLDDGTLSPDQATSALSYLGPTAQSQLIAAMKTVNPGFNWNTAVGQASATQQNAATLGTAQTQGEAAVLQSLPAMTSANVAASGIKNTIEQYLASNPNLNPSNLAAGNTLQQWIQGKQLTNPQYQTLFNDLNEYTNTLTPTLGVGGDSTNLKTEIAQSFVNAAASGQSIAQVLDNIQTLAEQKVQNLQSGASGGGVVAGAGSSTGSGGPYDF